MPETTRDEGQASQYGPEQQQNIDVMDLFRLDGRVAVVTGGAGIYGFVIATALAEAGASVVIASRTLAKCEAKAAELRAGGYRAVAMPLDLASDDSIVALREQVLAEFGRIDVLFNNAAGRVAGTAEELIKRGYAAPKSTMDGMTRGQWEGAMAINASGLFMCSQIFAEQMKAQGQGRQYRQYLVDLRRRRPDLRDLRGHADDQPAGLRLRQGGHHQLHALSRHLLRALRHPRQLHQPGRLLHGAAGGFRP